jgi:hypothetical protein
MRNPAVQKREWSAADRHPGRAVVVRSSRWQVISATSSAVKVIESMPPSPARLPICLGTQYGSLVRWCCAGSLVHDGAQVR